MARPPSLRLSMAGGTGRTNRFVDHRFWGKKIVRMEKPLCCRRDEVKICAWSATDNAVEFGPLEGRNVMEAATMRVPTTTYGASVGGGHVTEGKVVVGSHRRRSSFDTVSRHRYMVACQ